MQAAALLPSACALRVPPPPSAAPFTTQLELVERELDDDVRAGAAELMAGAFHALRLHAAACDLTAALRAPTGRPRLAALAADVANLARAFAASAGEPVVDVRLERICDDACRAFHRDRLRVRLTTTYAGPGTQYVSDADAPAALRLQGAFAGEIRTCRAGALAWMRGAEADSGRGLVHRSPPLAGTGVERLFLAVDAPSATSPPLWRPGDAAVLAAA